MKKFLKKIRAGGNDSSGPYSAPSDDGSGAETGTRLFWNSCNVNCGGLCLLRTHVRDGKIVRIETDNLGDDSYGNHQVRACLRGRSMRKRVYGPERLKYPMKRVGRRGEGDFRRISWDEAFDLIAGKMKHVKEKYGDEAFYITYATGSIDAVMSKSWPPSPIARLMNCFGGYLNYDNTYSYSQISTALTYTYGRGWVSGNSLSDIINSRLVVFFGNNPAETRMSGGGMVHDLLVAKKKGNAKVVMVDPRYNDTAVAVADEWVPIRPGTDAAFVSGLAHVLITENLVDEDFLAKFCVGYDEEHMPEGIPPGNSYKSYILGLGRDKTPKTPEWASRITGIPPDVIIRLGREIGQAKPAYISQGWGGQRHSNGEQTARAICMLSILTGNVGIHGGNTGARENNRAIPFAKFPTLENPVKTAIPVFLWTDAVMRGPEMTAKKDGVRGADRVRAHTKFIWNFAGNALINQHSDVNRTRKILEDDSRCEMIVVIEHFMTQSAMFADILLPSVTNLEENDFAATTSLSSSEMAYVIFNRKAIEPMFECRSVYDMCAEIAKRLDLWDRYTEGRTRDQWLQHILDESRKDLPDLPSTLEEAWEMGVYKKRNRDGPLVAYKTFRENPETHPLKTPSGKIEIFSKQLWNLSLEWELPEGDLIPALPEYTAGVEGHADPLRERFPLQMITHHYKQRTHSTYGNVDWLKEVAPQQLWINPLDARERGIRHGDIVLVYNNRGECIVPAKVTERILPGVLSLPQGAWFKPDKSGLDRGGCANTLTSLRPSPLSKGNPQHSNLVQVKKYEGSIRI